MRTHGPEPLAIYSPHHDLKRDAFTSQGNPKMIRLWWQLSSHPCGFCDPNDWPSSCNTAQLGGRGGARRSTIVHWRIYLCAACAVFDVI